MVSSTPLKIASFGGGDNMESRKDENTKYKDAEDKNENKKENKYKIDEKKMEELYEMIKLVSSHEYHFIALSRMTHEGAVEIQQALLKHLGKKIRSVKDEVAALLALKAIELDYMTTLFNQFPKLMKKGFKNASEKLEEVREAYEKSISTIDAIAMSPHIYLYMSYATQRGYVSPEKISELRDQLVDFLNKIISDKKIEDTISGIRITILALLKDLEISSNVAYTNLISFIDTARWFSDLFAETFITDAILSYIGKSKFRPRYIW